MSKLFLRTKVILKQRQWFHNKSQDQEKEEGCVKPLEANVKNIEKGHPIMDHSPNGIRLLLLLLLNKVILKRVIQSQTHNKFVDFYDNYYKNHT